MLELSWINCVLGAVAVLSLATYFYCIGQANSNNTPTRSDYTDAFNSGFDQGKIQGYWVGYTECIKHNSKETTPE